MREVYACTYLAMLRLGNELQKENAIRHKNGVENYGAMSTIGPIEHIAALLSVSKSAPRK